MIEKYKQKIPLNKQAKEEVFRHFELANAYGDIVIQRNKEGTHSIYMDGYDESNKLLMSKKLYELMKLELFKDGNYE